MTGRAIHLSFADSLFQILIDLAYELPHLACRLFRSCLLKVVQASAPTAALNNQTAKTVPSNTTLLISAFRIDKSPQVK